MAKLNGPPELSIFHTFKTKTDQLTGEAKRQRAIIVLLASNVAPVESTRTAIAQNIAKKNKVPWKNIYSGIFRDFDEVLIPLEIVREEGRLPLKRGPKALQEKGVPFYRLTEKGIIVALSFESDVRDEILKKFFGYINENEGEEGNIQITMISELSKTAPKLVYSIFENYVRGYCNQKIEELTPFSLDKIKQTQGEFLSVYKELLDGFMKLAKSDREKLSRFLDSII